MHGNTAAGISLPHGEPILSEELTHGEEKKYERWGKNMSEEKKRKWVKGEWSGASKNMSEWGKN